MERTLPRSDALLRAIRRGTELFGEGKFFESHEAWEDPWRRARPPWDRWIQGLIQAAAGFHKIGKGERMGARVLLDRAEQKFGGKRTQEKEIRSWLGENALRLAQRAHIPDPPPVRRWIRGLLKEKRLRFKVTGSRRRSR